MNKELVELIYQYAENNQEISMETDLIDDLGYDSISLVELMVQIELIFSIIIEDDDMDIDKLRKFAYLNSLIEKTNRS